MRKRIGMLSVFLAVIRTVLTIRAEAGIMINQGESCTNSGDVVLNISYPAYIYAVAIANEDYSTASTSVTSPINWLLSAGDGLKTVTATYHTSAAPAASQPEAGAADGYPFRELPKLVSDLRYLLQRRFLFRERIDHARHGRAERHRDEPGGRRDGSRNRYAHDHGDFLGSDRPRDGQRHDLQHRSRSLRDDRI